MTDLYCYPNSGVLRNNLGIQDGPRLQDAEADFVMVRMKQLHQKPLEGSYNFEHFCSYHRYLFQDVYDWAGKPRMTNIRKAERLIGFQSIEYADKGEIRERAEAVLTNMRETPWEHMDLEKRVEAFSRSLAELWKVHSFREGNTRSCVLFCLQFADSRKIPMDRNIMEKSGGYLRDGLVAWNARFKNTDISQKAFLLNLVKNSMVKGLEQQGKQAGMKKWEKAVEERDIHPPVEKTGYRMKYKEPELG